VLIVGAVVLALIAGLAAWLGGVGRSGPAAPVAAARTAPFADALSVLAAKPEVRYEDTVPGLGTVDVKVTAHDELVGTLTEDGTAYGLLRVTGRLYVKAPSSSLSGAGNTAETSALSGKWLTGQSVDALLGSGLSQFVPPEQLSAQLTTALGDAPTLPVSTSSSSAGSSVIAADTTLGVLYVSATTPYHVVSSSRRAPAQRRRPPHPARGPPSLPIA